MKTYSVGPYMIDGKIINISLLACVNVLKQIANIDITKKSIFIAKESYSINSDLLKIGLKGDLNGDILIAMNPVLKKKVVDAFTEQYKQLTNSDSIDIEQSAFEEIGNIIVAKISAYLVQIQKKTDITTVKYLSNVKEINYENIAVIDMSSPDGNISICIGINEIQFTRSISFLFFGFSEDSMEDITTQFIPKGFEVYFSPTIESFISTLSQKKIDIAIIDFYAVKPDLSRFLKSTLSALTYKVNLIFGVTKLDAPKLKEVPASDEKYQIIGIYLKTFSLNEMIKYIFTVIEKIGVKADDRRKHIRVCITPNNRYYVRIKDKAANFNARLVDISLGGFRAEIDLDDNMSHLFIGKELETVDIFLKFNRLITSCKVVSIDKKYFSVSYNNLTDQEKNIISQTIFKLLSEK